MGFATEIDPEGRKPITVYEAMLPWRLAIDMHACDQNQHFIFTVEIELEAGLWIVDQRLRVFRESPSALNRDMVLVINGVPVSPLPLVIIEPTTGPWNARLTVSQTNGITEGLRLLAV